MHVLSFLPPKNNVKVRKEENLLNLVDNNCQNIVKYYGETQRAAESKYHEHFALSGYSLVSIVQHEKNTQQEFNELFFDTSDYCLLKANCWLRSRDGKWSFKHQVSSENHVLVYEELCNVTEILNRLHKLLPESKPPSEYDTPTSYCNYCFAEFTTLRYRFSPLIPLNINWWVDVSSFGGLFYVVATIERPLIVHDEQCQFSTTLKEVYCLELPAPSKVIAYLHKQKPSLLADVRGIQEIPSLYFVQSNPFQSLHEQKPSLLADVQGVQEITSQYFLQSNPLQSNSHQNIDTFLQYAFRPGTEDFWDEGEEIKCSSVTTFGSKFQPSWQ